jgi:DNA recombination protein RmuC
VVLASPTTLIALLRAIAYGWKQQSVADNAERIRELGKELYDRAVIFADYLSEIAKGLEKANKAYNNAVASFDSRLVPSARKFREMGIGTADVPQLDPVETFPRPLLTLPGSEAE